MTRDAPVPGDEHKRVRILEATLDVCAQRGVGAARMEEVAARAQVSKTTLYRFFEGKDQLLLAALIASYEEGLRVAYENVDPKADPRRQLDQVLEGVVRVLEQSAPRMGVFYQVWGVVAGDAASRGQLHEYMRQFHLARHRELAQLVQRGQREGVFRTGVAPEVVAQSVDALLGGYCYWATFDPASATADALRSCFDTLVRGVLVADAPARAPDAADARGRERVE